MEQNSDRPVATWNGIHFYLHKRERQRESDHQHYGKQQKVSRRCCSAIIKANLLYITLTAHVEHVHSAVIFQWAGGAQFQFPFRSKIKWTYLTSSDGGCCRRRMLLCSASNTVPVLSSQFTDLKVIWAGLSFHRATQCCAGTNKLSCRNGKCTQELLF